MLVTEAQASMDGYGANIRCSELMCCYCNHCNHTIFGHLLTCT